MSREINRKPLHEQIADVLGEEIRADYQPGDRFGGDKVLAARFAVSSVTIREALLTLCLKGLLTRRRGSGTYVAEQLPVRRHIAVLFDTDISHPRLSFFPARVAQGLLTFFEQRGLEARLYTGRRLPWDLVGEPSCPAFLEDVETDRISGVVAVATRPHPRWADPLRRRGVPIVSRRLGFDAEWDTFAMARQAARHLIECGRRRIALLHWKNPADPADQPDLARQGLASELHRHGLSVEPTWIRSDLYPLIDGAGWAEFREVWSAKKEKPDGLIVCDDILFADAAVAILQAGIRVPEQLMVVTATNKGSGMLYPFPVARMESDPEVHVRIVGEMLLKMIAGEPVAAPLVHVPWRWLEPQTVVKPEAVAAPPDGRAW